MSDMQGIEAGRPSHGLMPASLASRAIARPDQVPQNVLQPSIEAAGVSSTYMAIPFRPRTKDERADMTLRAEERPPDANRRKSVSRCPCPNRPITSKCSRTQPTLRSAQIGAGLVWRQLPGCFAPDLVPGSQRRSTGVRSAGCRVEEDRPHSTQAFRS
jgi:hypothetical protein